MTTWRMHIASWISWITKATNTHSEYATSISCERQRRFRQRTYGTLPVSLLVPTLCKTIPSNILLQFNPLSQIHGRENSARLSDKI